MKVRVSTGMGQATHEAVDPQSTRVVDGVLMVVMYDDKQEWYGPGFWHRAEIISEEDEW